MRYRTRTAFPEPGSDGSIRQIESLRHLGLSAPQTIESLEQAGKSRQAGIRKLISPGTVSFKCIGTFRSLPYQPDCRTLPLRDLEFQTAVDPADKLKTGLVADGIAPESRDRPGFHHLTVPPRRRHPGISFAPVRLTGMRNRLFVPRVIRRQRPAQRVR